MPVTHWLHLEAIGGDPWIFPVWNAADGAVKAGKIPPLGAEFGELALHISTRLDILPYITRRITKEVSALHDATKEYNPKHVFTKAKQGKAFPVNRELKLCLIADIDAILYELNSCWELMRKLFQLVRTHIGRPIVGTVTDELRAAMGSRIDWWFRWLDRQRNFVAHEGTPYLAIDVTDGRWELLVMKENLTRFDDPDKFFTFSELAEVVRTFPGVARALQRHLIELFDQAKAAV